MGGSGSAPKAGLLPGLFQYWDGKRAGRRMPSRDDIDPADIPSYMPSVIICEVEPEPLRFRYRLIGTRLTELVHRDVTGLYIDEDIYGANFGVVEGPFREAYQSRAPVAVRGRLKWTNVEHAVAAIALPLSNDDAIVNMVLFAVDAGEIDPLLPDGVPVIHRDLIRD